MNDKREILESLSDGEISVDEAYSKLDMDYLEHIGEQVKLDVNRADRNSIPEIIFAEHKDNEVLEESISKMLEKRGRVIVSRIDESQKEIVKNFEQEYDIRLNSKAEMAVIKRNDFEIQEKGGKVGIITGGTSDVPLAEEVRIIVDELGYEPVRVYDAGVACLRRTTNALKEMNEKNVDVVVVLAGMEGALPSIINSLTDLPVIGLPTSVGYGFGGGGTAALLSMLQSCVPGLMTVNIDNSVGAAAAAVSIAKRVHRAKGEGCD